MNAEQILARLKTLLASFTRKQLLTIGGAFVGVVGLLVIWAYWLNAPTYRLLFSDMDPGAAEQVVEKLKAEKVSYELTDGGRAIKVPADKLDELRIDLSSQGLPSTGRIGFEIFDRTQFGQTDFLEHVNYRRALEGELERTIDTLREVESSRVHIAMAKDSLFTDRQQPAKASIVLKLRRRGDISQGTVNGIANMVAAAVEGLQPNGVVILDSFGRQLNQTGDDPLSGPRLDEQREIEHGLSTRVVRLLEPIVGIGKVRVNVSARLNPSSQEVTDEHWDPNAVVRSRQVTTDARGGAVQGGVAGARANLPPPLPKNPATGPNGQPVPPPKSLAAASGETPLALGQNVTHNSETTNYEISRVTRHSVTPAGEVSRLSVAVILDDQTVVTTDKDGKTVRSEKPLPAAQVQKIQGLVAAAVGLDTSRGDRLTVENIPFDETPMDEAPPAPTGWRQYMREIVVSVGVSLVLFLGLIVMLVARRKKRAGRKALAVHAATQAAAGVPGQPPRTVQDMQSEIEAQLDALSQAGEPRKLPVLTKRIGGMVSENPRAVAQLLRTWMAEDQR